MPIPAKGMLLTSMDVDPAHELDFNRWYDREHLAERVAIPGFVEARRYMAHDAAPRYLSLYSTKTFEVLDSPAYRAALANQTPWSKANIARFQNMIRSVARITISRGRGRGAALGLVRLRGATTDLRDRLASRFDPELHDGVIGISLLEGDPSLSRSLTNPADDSGASDWFILIEGTSIDAVASLTPSHFSGVLNDATVVSSGTYRLMFDLAAADL
ncbi:MAG: hypothetical protein JWP21_1166 [Tardiphaga sp.]|nr:hypothetical protein [Tardiphaga sp.]